MPHSADTPKEKDSNGYLSFEEFSRTSVANLQQQNFANFNDLNKLAMFSEELSNKQLEQIRDSAGLLSSVLDSSHPQSGHAGDGGGRQAPVGRDQLAVLDKSVK